MATRPADTGQARGHRDQGSLTPFAVITIFGLFLFGGGFAEAVLMLNQRARASDIAEQAARRVADNVDEAALREGRLVIRADECFDQADQIAEAHGEGLVTDCSISGLEVTKMVKTFKNMVENEARRSFGVLDRESGARLMFLYDYDDGTLDDPDGKYAYARLGSYGLLRHEHALESGADPQSPTLAGGVHHHAPLNRRRYTFALFRGRQRPLPATFRAEQEDAFGILAGDTVIERGDESALAQ